MLCLELGGWLLVIIFVGLILAMGWHCLTDRWYGK